MNLIANDVSRFDMVSMFIHHMWSGPLSTLIIGYFLYVEAGFAGVLGIAAVFVVVPIQWYTGKLSPKFRLQTAIKTDERVRLMDEIISGVQVIKMYAWEKPFCVMVALARKLELKVIQKSSWVRGIFMVFNLITTRAAMYCTLVGMMFFSQQLTAEKAFVFFSFFNILTNTMSIMFVRGVAEIAECIVAVRRLQHFLMNDEVAQLDTSKLTYPDRSSTIDESNPEEKRLTSDIFFIDGNNADTVEMKANTSAAERLDLVSLTNHMVGPKPDRENWALKITNAIAKWEPSSQKDTLNIVNVKLEQGKMYVVIGAVGAGKSSLISAILGELELSEGNIAVRRGLSYAAQEAWVFGSTVRQNIIFGQPYDRQRYQKVVKACALLSDFTQFPQGDQTIVGERGRSLSGGQKARISLARAVYRQADLYILDDPLSAVDTHVVKHLFEECLVKYLSGKTILLATHQLQYVKDVDGIILLEHGSSRMFSNYVDLLTQCPGYATLLASDSSQETNETFSEKSSMRRQWFSLSNRSTSKTSDASDTENDDDKNAEIANLERTSKGITQGFIFIKYFKSGGNWCFVITVAMFFVLTQFLVSTTDLFVPILVNEEESRNKDYSVSKNFTSSTIVYIQNYDINLALFYVYIYTGLVLSIFVVGITRSLLFYVLCIRNSQSLHDRSFRALIRTSMRFFDTNPSGRILNRFSKDMGAIDELLPKFLLDAGQIMLMMVGSLAVVCAVNPVFLIPLFVIAFIFYWIRKIYLRTSKNVKRLEGILRSPVFTHLNATINGLTTIRAYGAENILKFEFDKFQDVHSSAWYIFIATSIAFGFLLDIFCFIFTTIVTFAFILHDFGISGAEVGLAITTVISMTGLLQIGMRQGAEVTNQMMSVERLLEYSLLPPEDNIAENEPTKKYEMKGLQVTSTAVQVPENWPTEGCIKFQRVSMRYAKDELPVLKGLELVIKPREKVGIVGRTGAGKSSLISALFRLAKVEGVIDIDDVDTSSIYLEDLRRKISIIPQDPVLFSGTLRKNLDPFNEFQDSLLWAALEEVKLKDVFSGSNGLESRVFDRGTNFSAGQRQLICLARAILRKNKILILDEATANVDPHTDGLIQRAIRKKFANCTVLTIAHRLITIMDSDKVLVMEKGRMVEFDHPYILLENDFGQFTSLVKETGCAMTEQLTHIAKQAYKSKYDSTKL